MSGRLVHAGARPAGADIVTGPERLYNFTMPPVLQCSNRSRTRGLRMNADTMTLSWTIVLGALTGAVIGLVQCAFWAPWGG